MKKIILLAVLLILMMEKNVSSLHLEEAFKNSYRTFELTRNEKGFYRDSQVFNGTPYHPASIAGIGMAMIAECIADGMR